MLNCDNDIADVGDPCSNKGNFACTSATRGRRSSCDDGKYASMAQSCRGPKACAIVHPKPKVTDIDCDFTVANENDPCAFPGNEACSSDKKTMYDLHGRTSTSTPTACLGASGSCSVKRHRQEVAKVSCDGQGALPRERQPKKDKGRKKQWAST